MTRGHRVIEDPVHGYRRLDPIPEAAELASFYQSRYYDLVRQGGRGPDLARFLAGGEGAEREREWLRATLHADILHLIQEHAPGRRVLDVGCGTGELLLFLKEGGCDVRGTEPSEQAAAAARARGLEVHTLPLEEYAARCGSGTLDAVTLVNVLEHVPQPAALLRAAREAVAPGGIVCTRVPNDFSPLQRAAARKLGLGEYWLAVPDHINYFDYVSLARLLVGSGFETIHAQGDFPMEVFLLMGEDYVRDAQVGARCHERRRSLEEALPAQVRRRIYAALAREGLGRNCLTVARRAGS